MAPDITLYNEDCMKIINTLPDKSIDLLVTDPPYSFENMGGAFILIILQQREPMQTL